MQSVRLLRINLIKAKVTNTFAYLNFEYEKYWHFVSGLGLVTIGVVLLTIWKKQNLGLIFISIGIIMQFFNFIFLIKKE